MMKNISMKGGKRAKCLQNPVNGCHSSSTLDDQRRRRREQYNKMLPFIRPIFCILLWARKTSPECVCERRKKKKEKRVCRCRLKECWPIKSNPLASEISLMCIDPYVHVWTQMWDLDANSLPEKRRDLESWNYSFLCIFSSVRMHLLLHNSMKVSAHVLLFLFLWSASLSR